MLRRASVDASTMFPSISGCVDSMFERCEYEGFRFAGLSLISGTCRRPRRHQPEEGGLRVRSNISCRSRRQWLRAKTRLRPKTAGFAH